MFDRENAIGMALLLLCGVVAVVLLYSIATGTRFQYEGPQWLATVLMIVFIGGGLYGFIMRPGRRWQWPWQRDRNRDRDRDQHQDRPDR